MLQRSRAPQVEINLAVDLGLVDLSKREPGTEHAVRRRNLELLGACRGCDAWERERRPAAWQQWLAIEVRVHVENDVRVKHAARRRRRGLRGALGILLRGGRRFAQRRRQIMG